MVPGPDTPMHGGDASFPKTEWTRIVGRSQHKAILGELYDRYWRPLYCYLCYRGFDNDQAKDIVQGFFTDKVLGQQLVEKADRSRGRFRSFLITALKNYAINLHKQEKVPEYTQNRLDEPASEADPMRAFNRAWAEQVLQDVLATLEQECCQKGKMQHWRVFHRWLLEPPLETDQRRLSNLCDEVGIANPAQAHNMLTNAKRRFRAILREKLRPSVQDESAIDDEIADFLKAFSDSTA